MNHPSHLVPPKRTLIIGSGGRLGSDLQSAFSHQHLINLDRKALDLSNPTQIEETLLALDFEQVLISASITTVDYCEDHIDEAFLVNAKAPQLIAEIAASKGAHVTYISTDFVFDGLDSKPITEDAVPAPISVYGASKLKGEEGVLAVSSKNLVARVSWLYGPARPAFPEWIIQKALTETHLSLPSDKEACPTSSVEVAHTLKALLEGNNDGPAEGIYHVCNSGHCTWQEWGQACLDEARQCGIQFATDTIEANQLDDIPAFQAKRPAYSVLDNSKLAKFTGVQPREWREALSEHISNSEFMRRFSAAA